ncbi:Hypoxic response protein 1 [compost metagenome]
MKVKECMCHDVYCAKPETSVSDIAKMMNQNHVGCIPICNNQNVVVGLITDRDIVLRTIACGKDTNTTPASQIMTTNVCTCNAEDEVTHAQNQMVKNQVRRIPVVDKNQLVGILTVGDLTFNSQGLNTNEIYSTFEGICECDNSPKNNY